MFSGLPDKWLDQPGVYRSNKAFEGFKRQGKSSGGSRIIGECLQNFCGNISVGDSWTRSKQRTSVNGRFQWTHLRVSASSKSLEAETSLLPR